jgi:hypothetical protein
LNDLDIADLALRSNHGKIFWEQLAQAHHVEVAGLKKNEIILKLLEKQRQEKEDGPPDQGAPPPGDDAEPPEDLRRKLVLMGKQVTPVDEWLMLSWSELTAEAGLHLSHDAVKDGCEIASMLKQGSITEVTAKQRLAALLFKCDAVKSGHGGSSSRGSTGSSSSSSSSSNYERKEEDRITSAELETARSLMATSPRNGLSYLPANANAVAVAILLKGMLPLIPIGALQPLEDPFIRNARQHALSTKSMKDITKVKEGLSNEPVADVTFLATAWCVIFPALSRFNPESMLRLFYVFAEVTRLLLRGGQTAAEVYMWKALEVARGQNEQTPFADFDRAAFEEAKSAADRMREVQAAELKRATVAAKEIRSFAEGGPPPRATAMSASASSAQAVSKSFCAAWFLRGARCPSICRFSHECPFHPGQSHRCDACPLARSGRGQPYYAGGGERKQPPPSGGKPPT